MNQSLSRLVRMSLVLLLAAAGLALPRSAVKAGVGTVLTVTSNSDELYSGDGCTLREAMQAANNNADYNDCYGDPPSSYGSDSIVFALTGTNQITLGSMLPTISSETISIDGANAGAPVTIDGDDSYGLFYVTGGGELILSNLTLQHASISGQGGAIGNEGTLWVHTSTFIGNHAGNDGGAIHNEGAATIVNTTFVGNSADYGGGVSTWGGTLDIVNSTFSGNTATTHGGALETYTAGPTVTTTIVNTIMANSTAPDDCWNGAGAYPVGSYYGINNIIESTPSDETSCSSGVVSSSDPLLSAIAGSPGYFPLSPGSPAIDAGDATACGASPVNAFSQNGIPRPQDGNHDGAPVCDIGSVEAPVPVTLRSTGTRDGWILESSENSTAGGTKNSSGTTFRLGDDAADRQYRSILSFSTSSLPDDAVITSAKLKIKQAGLTGSNPFGSLGTIRVDMRRGAFGSSTELQLVDFQAAAHKANAASIPNSSSGGWYSKTLLKTNFTYVNRTGVTQFRLRFATDDNDNSFPDFLSFHSGEAASANRPALILTYYDPTP